MADMCAGACCDGREEKRRERIGGVSTKRHDESLAAIRPLVPCDRHVKPLSRFTFHLSPCSTGMFTFFAQTQARLGVVALRIATDRHGDVTLVTDQDGAYLGSNGGRVGIPLPGRPLPGTQTIRLVNGKGETKVPIHREESRVDIIRPPVSAGELNARRVTRARCNSCRHFIWNTPLSDLADLPPHSTDEPTTTAKRRRTSPQPHRIPQETGYTFRALPSSHWYESSEAWLCHPSGEFTKKLAGVMQDGWWPSRRVGLVGERWVGVDIGEVPREKVGEMNVVSRWCAVVSELGPG